MLSRRSMLESIFRFVCVFILNLYAYTKNHFTTLKKYLGKIHLGFDGWTSPNVISFLGVVVHLTNEGQLRSFILDFISLKKSHSGDYLAEELDKCLREFGIHMKVQLSYDMTSLY